ncbi:MAG: squalene/phytoene synthase family protein [SAR202 cluster bacterium]|nr:squalene/phytoene synthase family protein [SAR202 cluster bacterium]
MVDVNPGGNPELLTTTLKGVSRAFYLTLRVLPKPLRAPIGLAYLLARAADTIADTAIVPSAQRLDHVRSFRAVLEGRTGRSAIGEIQATVAGAQADDGERRLIAALPDVFSLLETLPPDDAVRVRTIVVTLTHGMKIDLTTFPPEESGRIAALKTREELDRYTYYVAGCVGEFWTEMCMAHIPGLEKRWDRARMVDRGVHFGKALQMTNVLRDVPKDLRIGRCYIPEAELGPLGLTPQSLMEASAGQAARPALLALLRVTLDHYVAAEAYLTAIPRRHVRLRLAVLWPILIGLATLGKLARNDRWLDPSVPSKVSRRWVYRTMLLSMPMAMSSGLLRRWIKRLRRQVEQGIGVG